MTQDQLEKSYAVICLNCRQPISISPAVAERLRHESREASNVRERQCQVFHQRCMNCGKEKPYRISEVVDMDESSHEQAASWSWQQPLSRSAASR